MEITVHLFASLAEAAGARRLTLHDVEEPVSAGDLAEAVFRRYPSLAPLRDCVLYAVNAEYVQADYPIAPSDEVALIPPVSGGTDDARFQIRADPLDLGALQDLVRSDGDGAISLFVGVVRNTNQGRAVAYLEYDAYSAMATTLMRQIADEIRERWPVTSVAMHHRVGRLAIGDASVAIAVSAPHRGAAIAACQYAIDRLKAIVPIWKKEVWTDGEHWIEGSLAPRAEAAPAPRSTPSR